MTEKTLAPYRAIPKPGSKTLARQADALSARLLKFLSGKPALTAASVLSGMLRDTSDPAMRLAIMTTRIQVLRARTIACRMGRPVDGKIKLGAVLEEQRSTPLPPEVIDPTQVSPDPAPVSEPTPQTSDDLVQLELLESYIHEGFSLPKGAIFSVKPQVVDDLVARGIAGPLTSEQSELPAPPDSETAQDGMPEAQDTDTAQVPALKPYEPDASDASQPQDDLPEDAADKTPPDPAL